MVKPGVKLFEHIQKKAYKVQNVEKIVVRDGFRVELFVRLKQNGKIFKNKTYRGVPDNKNI